MYTHPVDDFFVKPSNPNSTSSHIYSNIVISNASHTLCHQRTLRKKDVTKFHVQLCIAIFCMLLVFVIGIDRTSVYGGCVAVSALIHYFTLAAFMWMGAEAVLMFQKLVIVFVRITTKYIFAVSVICWGKHYSNY